MHCTKGVTVVSLTITGGITVGPVLAKVFAMILEFILLIALMSEMPRPGVLYVT